TERTRLRAQIDRGNRHRRALVPTPRPKVDSRAAPPGSVRRPRARRARLLAHALLVVLRRRGIELPAIVVALGILLLGPERFVLRVRDPSGAAELVDDVLVGCRRRAPDRFLAAVGLIQRRIDVAA